MVRLNVVDSWANHDGRLLSEAITVTLKPGSENI